MKVKYHVLQRDDESGKTRDKFLFTAEKQKVIVGNQVKHENMQFRVEKLEWIDRDIGILKAVCLEMPGTLKK